MMQSKRLSDMARVALNQSSSVLDHMNQLNQAQMQSDQARANVINGLIGIGTQQAFGYAGRQSNNSVPTQPIMDPNANVQSTGMGSSQGSQAMP